jgi:hypothetical protein
MSRSVSAWVTSGADLLGVVGPFSVGRPHHLPCRGARAAGARIVAWWPERPIDHAASAGSPPGSGAQDRGAGGSGRSATHRNSRKARSLIVLLPNMAAASTAIATTASTRRSACPRVRPSSHPMPTGTRATMPNRKPRRPTGDRPSSATRSPASNGVAGQPPQAREVKNSDLPVGGVDHASLTPHPKSSHHRLPRRASPTGQVLLAQGHRDDHRSIGTWGTIAIGQSHQKRGETLAPIGGRGALQPKPTFGLFEPVRQCRAEESPCSRMLVEERDERIGRDHHG